MTEYLPLENFKNRKRARNFNDKTGRTYGRLHVDKLWGYARVNGVKKLKLVYECTCKCGKVVKSLSGSLATKQSVSCGCYNSERTTYYNIMTKTKVLRCTRSSILQSYKVGAKDRNLEFSISKDYFYSKIVQNCYYCGTEPKQIRKARNGKLSDFYYNGIDRIDSSKGYTIENCVTACGKCNRAKNAMPLSEFLDLIKSIYEKHNLQKKRNLP